LHGEALADDRNKGDDDDTQIGEGSD
jgi:hypothetical protein